MNSREIDSLYEAVGPHSGLSDRERLDIWVRLFRLGEKVGAKYIMRFHVYYGLSSRAVGEITEPMRRSILVDFLDGSESPKDQAKIIRELILLGGDAAAITRLREIATAGLEGAGEAARALEVTLRNRSDVLSPEELEALAGMPAVSFRHRTEYSSVHDAYEYGRPTPVDVSNIRNLAKEELTVRRAKG